LALACGGGCGSVSKNKSGLLHSPDCRPVKELLEIPAGGIEPGDFRKVLIYNKDRVFAFVLALGNVSDEWYAGAAGAINFGFPTIADTPIPQILPTGVCTYEHVVSNIPPSDRLDTDFPVLPV